MQKSIKKHAHGVASPQMSLGRLFLFFLTVFLAGLGSLVVPTGIPAFAAPDAPPIAVPDDRLNQPIGAAVAVNVLSNDIDADNDLDPASVRLINPVDLSSLLPKVVVAGEGTWQVNTTSGAITFSPCTRAGQPAEASCTGVFRGDPFPMEYMVSDRAGQRSNPAIITITFDLNSTALPVLQNDQANTVQGQAVTINVLANDVDPDGTMNPASVSVSSQPSRGSARANADGTITYTPRAAEVGADSFSYRACNTDPTPECATANVNVLITPPAENRAPTVISDTPPPVAHNQSVVVNVLANDSDPDGQLVPSSVTVTIPAGNGSAVPAANGSGTITYTPNSGFSGNDRFTYRVCDNGAPVKCGTAQVFLTVLASSNQAPVANDDQAATQQNRAVAIPVLSNDRDPEGALNPASLRVTDSPTAGTVAINTANGNITYTPNQSFTGADTFKYTVCDSAPTPLCSNKATVSVTVSPPANQPPVAVNDNAATQEGTPVTINVLSNDRDPEGALNRSSLRVTGNPTRGTAVKNSSNNIVYTPNAAFTGADSFTYEVCDGGTPPLCDSATVAITVAAKPNEAPVAVNDAVATQQGQAITIAVLANDRDPEGALNPASVKVKSGPASGQTQINGTSGAIAYTPNANFTGNDSFTYEVCDRGAPPLCATATVSVTVVGRANQAPVAVNDSVTTRQGQPTTINVLSNDQDPENALNPASVQITAGPTKGQAQPTPAGAVTYTPTAGATGTDSFKYKVCDSATPALCSNEATVTVTILVQANQAPIASDDNAATAQGRAVIINVLTNDRDPDGTLNPASVTVKTGPANGQTQVNTTNGAVTYTPNANSVGSDTFTYEVCDNATPALCATAAVSVSVIANANVAPVAVNDNGATPQGQALIINVLANDTDPDGTLNPASVTVKSGPGSGLTQVNTTSGAITYTPNANFAGSDTFTYEVCDSATPALCATATVRVTVIARANARPVAVDDSATTQENTLVVINVLSNDSDPDGALNPASVTVKSGPTSGQTQVNTTSGAITYTPNALFTGSDAFTYEVCDSATPALCATAAVAVTVNAASLENSVNAVDDRLIGTVNQTLLGNVLTNDSDPQGDGLQTPTVATEPVHGTVAPLAANGSFTYTPAQNYVGDDSFTYELCDDNDVPACAEATVRITLRAAINQPPTAVDDEVNTRVNQTVRIDVLANDRDEDGALVTSTLAISANAQHGTAAVSNGAIDYTPANAYSGEDSFTYQICDDGAPAACDEAAVKITIAAGTAANLAPVAVDDTVSTSPDLPVTINVLNNDIDLDGQLVTASLVISGVVTPGSAQVVSGTIRYTPDPEFVGPVRFNYTICDNASPPACATATVTVNIAATANTPPIAVDDFAATRPGQPVTIAVLTNDVDLDGELVPATLAISGTVTTGSAQVVSGTIRYTPSAEFLGEVRFAYEICDNSVPAGCDTADVMVTITNADNVPPIAVDDSAVTTPGRPITINVLANDLDLDGELDPATLAISGTVTSGTAAVVNGAIQYTPAASFVGEVRFAYEVCDNGAPPACDLADVTVSIRATGNISPIAVDDNAATLPNRAVTIAVLANDVDIDGSLVLSSLTIVTPTLNGTTAVDNGVVAYTPALDFVGQDSFVYEICDDGTPQACAEATVSIRVIETTEENEAYVFNDAAFVRAGKTVVGNVLSNDLDPEEDGWQAPTVETSPTQGTVALTADGAFTYTADLDFTGSDTWRYRVCDLGEPEACGEADVLITVAPANAAPLAVDDRVTTNVATPVSGNVLLNDSDPDGDALTVVITPTVAAENGQVTLSADGQFTYTPAADFAGSDAFDYTVCDPDDLCAAATVTIDVRAQNVANGAPYAADDRAVAWPDTPVKVMVLANDADLDGLINPASVALVGEPSQGTAAVEADGSITVRPTAGAGEAVRFGYRICDDGTPVLCARALVIVDIVSAGPNATYAFEDMAWGRVGDTLRGNVLINDLDLEGDVQRVDVTPVLLPNHGQVTLAVDGTFSYTPQGDFMGTDQFTYKVCDDGTPQACTMAQVFLHLFPPNLGWDFGDAVGFPTDLAADGPRHAIVEGLSLGATVDAEMDGIPDSAATTDNLTELDDETIIAAFPAYDGRGVYSLDVPVTNTTAYPAQLVGWIDWNVNFSFDDVGERALPGLAGYNVTAASATDNTFATGNVPAGFSGMVTLTWEGFEVPAAQSPAKYLRLRLAGNLPGSAPFFTAEGPAVMGQATGGAIVDTLAPIRTQRVLVTAFTALPAESETDAGVVNFAWITTLESGVAGFNVLVERGGELVPVNGALIPSQVTNSTSATNYAYAAPVEGDIFYLQVVMLSGETFLHGPARLGFVPPPTSGKDIFLPFVRTGTANQ